MSRILFRGFDLLPNRVVGYADIFVYSLACYLKGKKREYNNIDIIFPRFGYDSRWNIPRENQIWQKTSFLPWTWINRELKINENKYDSIIYTNRKNSLYKGYPGLNSSGRFFYAYLDIYYKLTGKEPVLNIPREKQDKPYILLQYRDIRGKNSEIRNTNVKRLLTIYDIIKEKYGDRFSYYKIGEPSPIDDRFDKSIPLMYGDVDNFCKLIRNSSLLVSGHSGPQGISLCFPDVPTIRLDMRRKFNPRDETHWKRQVGDISKLIPYHPLWCDNRLFDINPKESIEKERIFSFLDGQQLYGE